MFAVPSFPVSDVPAHSPCNVWPHSCRAPGCIGCASDLSSLVFRHTRGARIKHGVKQNWLKMYEKSGLVLWVETVISDPEEFRVRKQVLRKGKHRAEWVPMRECVDYLFRYHQVSLQANARNLDAPAPVDDPTHAKRALHLVTAPEKHVAGRRCLGLHPLTRHDAKLFQTLMAGEHCVRGFTIREIRSQLASSVPPRACAHDPRKQSMKLSPTFRRFHAHGLLARIPHARRWRRTHYRRQPMTQFALPAR